MVTFIETLPGVGGGADIVVEEVAAKTVERSADGVDETLVVTMGLNKLKINKKIYRSGERSIVNGSEWAWIDNWRCFSQK